MDIKQSAFAFLILAACASVLSSAQVVAPQTRLAAARARSSAATADFKEFVAEYRRGHERFHAGTTASAETSGDAGGLVSRSPAALAAEERRLRSALAELERTRTWLLSARLKIEHADLAAHARLALSELSERAVWRREPHRYVRIIAADADRTLRDPTLSINLKVGTFLDRSRDARRILDEARRNLAAADAPSGNAIPPRLFTEAGITDARLAARFFREIVPQLFERAGAARLNAATRGDIDRATRFVAGELGSFARWLEDELLPRSSGSLSSGANALRAVLRSAGTGDAEPETLARLAEAELREVQERARLLAETIAPGQGVAGALQILRRERPTAAGLAGDTRLELDRLRAFLRGNDLLAAPDRFASEVDETPFYLRAHSIALVESDAKITTSRLLVTPPDADADRQAQEEHLALFNRYELPFLTAHYAMRFTPADEGFVYNSVAARALADGRASYCEEALLDAGFGGNNPRYTLAQLRRRAIDLSRHLVALGLHSGRMSYDEAVRFFEREAHAEPSQAKRLVREVALDPLTALGVIGHRDLTKLKLEANRRQGRAFRIGDFHDAVFAESDSSLARLRDRISASFDRGDAVDSDAAGELTMKSPAPNSDRDTTNQEPEFTVLAIGSMSDYEGGRAAQLVNDAREFRRLWLGGNLKGDVPAINFATRSVIFVRQGQQSSGGYGIGVRAVRRTPNEVVLEVDETRPAPDGFTTQVITSPFIVISVPRINPGTPIRFADAASTKPAREPQRSTAETIAPRKQARKQPSKQATPTPRRPTPPPPRRGARRRS